MLPEDAEITLYSDSNLCVQTVNEWAAGWEGRGWRRKTGPIANLELVQELCALAQRHPRVTVRWIKAHDGSRWNEYADVLAAREARPRRLGRCRTLRPRRKSRSADAASTSCCPSLGAAAA